ncbi:MAG: MFS transporter [Enterobacteriaceae bacterium]
MARIVRTFRALYSTTLLLLIGTGLLNTYLALRLEKDKVDELWVGALMAAHYAGLVLGSKLGHLLISRVGFIRAYVACAGAVTATVLFMGLVEWLEVWLVLRVLMGMGLMCQYMVIETWLNEQAESNQRGVVFGAYMAVTYLGIVLGQLILVFYPVLGSELLMLIALSYALCLIPVALTRRIYPTALQPAPLEVRYFVQRAGSTMLTILYTGFVTGAFYGLAPIYASQMGMPTEQVGLFMGGCILTGFLVQWPLGWLSDRFNRGILIRYMGLLLALASIPLAVLPLFFAVNSSLLLWLLIPFALLASMPQFTLYPLAVAFANDHIESDRRIALTGMLLVCFGIGACIGPLLTGMLMKFYGANMLYVLISACGFAVVWLSRSSKISAMNPIKEAPLQHVATPDNMGSSPLRAALDPRNDEQIVQEQMLETSEVEEQIKTALEEEPAKG